MTNDPLAKSAQSLWQSQPAPALRPDPPSPEFELRGRMSRLERRVFWRNMREYGASALAVGAYAYFAWKFPPLLIKAGSILIIAGVLFVVYQLHRRGARRLVAGTPSNQACLDFYRSELERQRQALRTIWSWYLLPFLPGMAVFLLGTSLEAGSKPLHWERVLLSFASAMGAILLAFWAVAAVNHRAADKLQRQIDEITALQHGDGFNRPGSPV